ncbi:MAG: c-type cytochrome [Bacteroidetes bacterium]|nr:c-type cytochrome [Bacteroidota bacterium]
MRKLFKILGVIVLLLLIAIAGFSIYFHSKFPVKIEATNVKVEVTPERLKRGEYLVQHVVGCVDCHSDRDFHYYAGPITESTLGKGGTEFNETFAGIPGKIYAANITPAGLKDWSDGELIRMIRTGINKNGEAKFPLMPYTHYAGLCQEDLYSVVAYVRSLKPIENTVPAQNLDFPMSMIVKTIPQPAPALPPAPDKNDPVAYGKYVVNAVGCIECHTQADKGNFLPGMEFAGGRRFQLPNGDVIHTANITPDLETGIGNWTKEAFIQRFKSYVDSTGNAKWIPVQDHQKTTVMPWTALGGMTEEDLGAIYSYLRTIKPVRNKVETFTPAGKL